MGELDGGSKPQVLVILLRACCGCCQCCCGGGGRLARVDGGLRRASPTTCRGCPTLDRFALRDASGSVLELVDIGNNVHARASAGAVFAQLERASSAGVRRVLLTGTSLESSRAALALCAAWYGGPGARLGAAGRVPARRGARVRDGGRAPARCDDADDGRRERGVRFAAGRAAAARGGLALRVAACRWASAGEKVHAVQTAA
jgi:hypothetical protein